MSITYIHLSDIHFGQEKGGEVVIHNDAKERLIEDVTVAMAALPQRRANGIIVTGDIAYAGKVEEYTAAGAWLDRVANAAGCDITSIQVVPGNHDIDLARISPATKLMLGTIIENGEAELDTYLANEQDRELLYARFAAYRPFAEGYNCSLDRSGGLASNRVVEVAPNRLLRFIGLNSALVCSGKDKAGSLLLGARQRVLPKEPGQELIVLCHHPLNWLRDSVDARKYVRSRARVFISGHEHKPAVHVDQIEEGQDLMMLAAGATIPPTADEIYTYTYNIIEFEWDERSDSLRVAIHPRAWNDNKKEFREDVGSLGGDHRRFLLGCPHFRSLSTRQPGGAPSSLKETGTASAAEQIGDRPVAEAVEPVPVEYPLLLLRFFRDLTSSERLAILVKLGALPTDWAEPLTHSIERRALDTLSRKGRIREVEECIARTIENRPK
ncbi:hypothetical protein FRZ61_31770 [Hypericibacter adhaerens]|uniref:Uncharacterized protein n=1 Tax=Hypericibacter adhaerens TaxID=2602016 RepID=A0A5J6N0P7_9PROT|nr:metallophosphoesterase [Hypericibacter adhaerens]QEX23241.1 hypothetical protein FRZ61_31770 [Hypericibacter adhaerens]